MILMKPYLESFTCFWFCLFFCAQLQSHLSNFRFNTGRKSAKLHKYVPALTGTRQKPKTSNAVQEKSVV